MLDNNAREEVLDALAARMCISAALARLADACSQSTVGTQPRLDAFHEAFQPLHEDSATTGYAPSAQKADAPFVCPMASPGPTPVVDLAT